MPLPILVLNRRWIMTSSETTDEVENKSTNEGESKDDDEPIDDSTE